MARRIKSANIRFISLCERGANRLPVLYKADDQTVEFDPVVKADMDAGELTAVVYAPEARDSQGDVADQKVIKEMAYGFMRNGEGVDIKHDFKSVGKDRAHVAESFIIQKSDPRFVGMKDYHGNPVDVTNGWAVVIKIDDPELRKAYREGKWNGVSMGGSGVVEVEKDSSEGVIDRVFNRIAKLLGIETKEQHSTGDIDMDKNELNTTLGEFKKGLLADIGTLVANTVESASLAKAAGVTDKDTPEVAAAKIVLHKNGLASGTTQKTEAPATTKNTGAGDKPVFKGDIAKAEDVAKFEYDVAVWKIRSEMDATDPASIKKAAEEIAKLAKPGEKPGEDDTAAGIEKDDTDEVKTLKRDLHKAQKRSNQPVASKGNESGKPGEGSTISGLTLTKEEQDGLSIGDRMAKFANEQRGFGEKQTA